MYMCMCVAVPFVPDSIFLTIRFQFQIRHMNIGTATKHMFSIRFRCMALPRLRHIFHSDLMMPNWFIVPPIK